MISVTFVWGLTGAFVVDVCHSVETTTKGDVKVTTIAPPKDRFSVMSPTTTAAKGCWKPFLGSIYATRLLLVAKEEYRDPHLEVHERPIIAYPLLMVNRCSLSPTINGDSGRGFVLLPRPIHWKVVVASSVCLDGAVGVSTTTTTTTTKVDHVHSGMIK